MSDTYNYLIERTAFLEGSEISLSTSPTNFLICDEMPKYIPQNVPELLAREGVKQDAFSSLAIVIGNKDYLTSLTGQDQFAGGYISDRLFVHVKDRVATAYNPVIVLEVKQFNQQDARLLLHELGHLAMEAKGLHKEESLFDYHDEEKVRRVAKRAQIGGVGMCLSALTWEAWALTDHIDGSITAGVYGGIGSVALMTSGFALSPLRVMHSYNFNERGANKFARKHHTYPIVASVD